MTNKSLIPWPTTRYRISPAVPAAAQLQAAQTCSLSASYQFSIDETAPCDESGFPACDRKPLQQPVPAAVVPRTSPFPDSTYFVHPECAAHSRIPLLPTPSTDVCLKRFFDKEKET